MKRFCVLLLCLLMLITALAGCAPAAQNAAPAAKQESTQPAGDQSPSGENGQVITLDSAGKTIELKTGDQLTVKLGEDYVWEIDVTPDLIVGKVDDATLGKGEQGVFQAKMVGKAVIQATGKPACAKDSPPCDKKNQQFNVNLTVSNP
jgi:hypothetical protein